MKAEYRIRKRKNKSGTTSWCVDLGEINGERQRKFFRLQADAKKFAKEAKIAARKKGHLGLELKPKQLIEAKDCFELLAPHGTSLSEAVSYYLRHVQPKGGLKTVDQVAAELLIKKQQSNKKKRYLGELGFKFKRFGKSFGAHNISELHAPDVHQWLYSQKFSEMTRSNYHRDLGVLFQFAVKQKYCSENPMADIEKPTFIPSETKILEINQIVVLLAEALDYKKCDLIPYITIGLFAGLRAAELEHLDWKAISFGHRVITVGAHIAKSSKDRHVQISRNLMEWLEPYRNRRQQGGKIVTKGWYDHLQKVVKRCELKWPHNALRHSFGSYHLAFHQSAGVTATQMGHRDNKMIHQHYKQLIPPATAKQYWTIIPPKSRNSWAWSPIFADWSDAEINGSTDKVQTMPLTKAQMEAAGAYLAHHLEKKGLIVMPKAA